MKAHAKLIQPSRALVVLNPIVDYLEGGPLGCIDGAKIVSMVTEHFLAMRENGFSYDVMLVVRDWHEPELVDAEVHMSNNPALWMPPTYPLAYPPHAIVGTPGIALAPHFPVSDTDAFAYQQFGSATMYHGAMIDDAWVGAEQTKYTVAQWLDLYYIEELAITGLGLDCGGFEFVRDAEQDNKRAYVLTDLCATRSPAGKMDFLSRLRSQNYNQLTHVTYLKRLQELYSPYESQQSVS